VELGRDIPVDSARGEGHKVLDIESRMSPSADSRPLSSDIEEKLAQPSGRVRSGQAGGSARTNKLTPEKRREIAKLAALARWGT